MSEWLVGKTDQSLMETNVYLKGKESCLEEYLESTILSSIEVEKAYSTETAYAKS